MIQMFFPQICVIAATMTQPEREPNQEQHQLIADLLDRQDDALIQIDQLNARIEQLIKDISQERQEKIERQVKALATNQKPDPAVDASTEDRSEAS